MIDVSPLVQRRLELRLSPTQVGKAIGVPAQAVDDVLDTGLDDLPLKAASSLASLLRFRGVSELQQFLTPPDSKPNEASSSPCATEADGGALASTVLALLGGWGEWIDQFVLAEQLRVTIQQLEQALKRLDTELLGSGLCIANADAAVRLTPDPNIYSSETEARLTELSFRNLDPPDSVAHLAYLLTGNGGSKPVRSREKLEQLLSPSTPKSPAHTTPLAEQIEYSICDPLILAIRRGTGDP